MLFLDAGNHFPVFKFYINLHLEPSKMSPFWMESSAVSAIPLPPVFFTPRAKFCHGILLLEKFEDLTNFDVKRSTFFLRNFVYFPLHQATCITYCIHNTVL